MSRINELYKLIKIEHVKPLKRIDGTYRFKGISSQNIRSILKQNRCAKLLKRYNIRTKGDLECAFNKIVKKHKSNEHINHETPKPIAKKIYYIDARILATSSVNFMNLPKEIIINRNCLTCNNNIIVFYTNLKLLYYPLLNYLKNGNFKFTINQNGLIGIHIESKHETIIFKFESKFRNTTFNIINEPELNRIILF